MKPQPIRGARGVHDILPASRPVWAHVERAAHAVCRRFGYEELDTAILEPVQLVERGVGGGTDVVQKELFRVRAHEGGQELVLRPEGTAGTLRAYFEGGLNQGPQPARLYMLGPMFRAERPQKGRFREFHQLNIEAIGDPSPALDAEVIEMGWTWLADVGLDGVSLHLNSIGDAKCRPAYLEQLAAYYEPFREQLHPDCRRKLDTNPLRVLDCKHKECERFRAGAPRLLEHLCAECAAAFAQVRRLLEAAAIEYELDPYLVRGLDYYVRTAFEYHHRSLGGAQNALGGGGRYDGLAEEIGWPATPGVGLAAGLERVVELASEAMEIVPQASADLLVLPDGEELAAEAAEVARIARASTAAAVDYSSRSLKAKMRGANRIGARWVALMNADEARRRVVQLREMAASAQQEVAWDELPNRLLRGLEA